MKKLYLDHTRKAVYSLLITVLILFSSLHMQAQQSITSNTNWSIISPTPTSATSIVVKKGATVTIDVPNAVCNSISLGGDSPNKGNGSITFNSNSALTVGNINIGAAVGANTYSGSINMTSGGTLNIGGTIATAGLGLGTFTAGSGTIVYNGTTTQTVSNILSPYNNLTLSGSNVKTITGVTVNGILSMEGTTSVNVAPTYGTNATLQYNRTSDLTISSSGSPEWISSFTGTGGIVIKNTGVITLAKPVTTSKLTVEPGAKFSNALGNTLTNNGTIIINSDALNNSGSLINYGTVGGTGTVTYNRWLKAGDYQLISAPVNTSASGGSWQSGKIETFDTYHENDDFWYEASKTADLVNGKGYGMIASTAGAVGFTGTLNGTVTYDLGKTNTPQFIYGWNLVGNPYTSAIGINNQSTETNFLGVNTGAIDDNHEAVYVWDVDAYKCIANSGFTFPMLGGEETLGQNYLQAGQGFFIRAATDESAISFNINMQAHQPTIELKSAEKSWPGVQLKAKTADAGHYTIVTYHQDMTPGLDVSYDAGLLSAGGEIELFTRLVNDNGVDFMIQAVPDYDFEQNAVPVGVNFAKGGEVTFSGYVVPLDGNYKIYLEDRLTGVLTDLSQDEYTVTLSANTKGTGRFFVVAAQTTGIETPGEISDNLMIWASDRKIHIRGELSGKATARLLDLNGRLIMETSLPDTRNNLVQAPVRTGGIYLLQVLDGNRHTTRKVVIN